MKINSFLTSFFTAPGLITGIMVLAMVLNILPACNLLEAEVSENGNSSPAVTLRELSPQEQLIAEKSNEFAFTLLDRMAFHHPSESFFISPISISMAFGMALNGADGATYEEMLHFFGYESISNEEINRAFRDLIRLLTQLDPDARMEIANSIWYRKGFEVLEDFLNTNANYFEAEIEALDFSDPAAVDVINGWIHEKTGGLIDRMIEQIGRDVVMYLINAIYFKADWTYRFDPDQTREEYFTNGSGNGVQVPMMHLRAPLRYYMDNSWHVVDLPYGDERFSFTALLPRDPSSIRDIAGKLSRADFDTITENLTEDTVTVAMPRFQLDYAYEEIMDDLIDMGLQSPFGLGDPADFSRIHPEEPLLISDVMHRARIIVDEEGSEAAAVTIIEISRTSAGPDPRHIRLDRPFLFFIRENHTQTILFFGQYSGPH